MTPRVAATAFAVSALFAAPAMAGPEHNHDHDSVSAAAALQVDLGNGLAVTLAGGDLGLTTAFQSYGYNGYRGARSNRGYGYNDRYDRRREKQQRRRAVRACVDAVKYKSHDRGFHDVEYDGVEGIRKISPNGYRVRAEFEFETRRRDIERDVVCTVRRGRVVNVEGVPQRPRGRRNSGYGYNDYGYRLDTVEFGFGNWNGRKNYRDYNRNDWNQYDIRHRGHDHERGEICKLY